MAQTTSKNKTRDKLVEMYLKSLEEDVIPWRQEWNGSSAPYSAISNIKYKGVNNLVLTMVSIQENYKDPRWCTFKQVNEKGWKIKAGSHGTPVEYWMPYDNTQRKYLSWKEYGKLSEDEQENCAIYCKTSYVFNASQIEGIPGLEFESGVQIDSSPFIDNLINKLNVGYIEQGTRAFYSPSKDSVTIPQKEYFKSEYGYNATRLHELCHATGHKSRLNRPMKGSFGSSEYAKEELRAEISASFLSNEIGLPISDENLDNHKSYIQGWIRVLKNNPEELFKAIKDADKITDYVLVKGEWERFKEQSVQKDIIENENTIIDFKEVFESYDGQKNIGRVQVERTGDGRYIYKESGYSDACDDREMTRDEVLELYESYDLKWLNAEDSLELNAIWYEQETKQKQENYCY